jgi:hypothetical protein
LLQGSLQTFVAGKRRNGHCWASFPTTYVSVHIATGI